MDFDPITKSIGGLLDEFKGRLSDPVLDGVENLLFNDGPVLALEELCAYLHEQDVLINQSQLDRIVAMGSQLDINPNRWSCLVIQR